MTAARTMGRREERGQRGYTLIEILVVLTILVLVVAGASLGISSVTRAHLRSGTVMIATAIRTGYTRAITQGHPVRLVLAMDEGKVWLEETEDRLLLSRDADDDAAGSSGAAGEGSEEAPAAPIAAPGGGLPEGITAPTGVGNLPGATPSLSSDFQLGASTFKVGESNTPRYRGAQFQRIEGKRFDPRELPSGVRILAVYTAHTVGRREQGTQYLFFWPGGMTERAVIQVADSDGTTFSIVVHPLTGRTRIESVPVEPEADLTDEEEQPEEAVDDEG